LGVLAERGRCLGVDPRVLEITMTEVVGDVEARQPGPTRINKRIKIPHRLGLHPGLDPLHPEFTHDIVCIPARLYPAFSAVVGTGMIAMNRHRDVSGFSRPTTSHWLPWESGSESDWHTVKALEQQYMREQLRRAGTPGPRVIGLDEVSIKKGHTYRIVVSDLIRQRPIWFGGTDRQFYT